MKKTKACTLFLILFIFVLLQSSFARSVDGRKNIKVSFSKYGALNSSAKINENYYYEWLQYLSKYINWNFESVDVDLTYNEKLDLLKSGDIDMLPAIEKTAEREQYCNFSTESIGINKVFLVKNKSNTSIKDDIYQTYKNKKIGLIKKSADNAYFFSFAMQNSSTPSSYHDYNTDPHNAWRFVQRDLGVAHLNALPLCAVCPVFVHDTLGSHRLPC